MDTMSSDLIKQYWQNFLYSLKEKGQSFPDRYEAWHFCNDESSANSLAKLVYFGQKTATASLAWSYETEGSPLPKAGDIGIITMWDGTPVCIIETTECQVIPFEEVPSSFAYDEGEGDRSLEYWRKVHMECYSGDCAKIGKILNSRTPIVCEHFRVVYKETGLFSG